MKKQELSIITLIVIILSCNHINHNQNHKLVSIVAPKSNNTLISYSRKWKKDSLGCSRFRSKEKADTIIDLLRQNIISTKVIYQTFGKPNEQRQFGDTTIIIYYFDCLCNNTALVIESDKCYAEFYMESDTLALQSLYVNEYLLHFKHFSESLIISAHSSI